MDLYVSNGGTIEGFRAGKGDRYPGGLYRNNRDGTFTDVRAQQESSTAIGAKARLLPISTMTGCRTCTWLTLALTFSTRTMGMTRSPM